MSKFLNGIAEGAIVAGLERGRIAHRVGPMGRGCSAFAERAIPEHRSSLRDGIRMRDGDGVPELTSSQERAAYTAIGNGEAARA